MKRIALTLALLLCAAPALAAGEHLIYPVAPRGDVTDTFFGTVVPDPYRSLETIDAPATQSWVKAEGALTRSYLDAIPQRPAIRAAYSKLLNYERLGSPIREGHRYFFSRNSGLQNQSVLYVRQSENGPASVFFDPNKLSSDGTVALEASEFTRDGKLWAYSTSASGSDWQTFHVRNVATGTDLPDTVAWSKFSDAQWIGDRGFYYAGYDKPADANTTLAALGVQKVWFHTLGTPQSADRLVAASTKHPDEFLSVAATEDEALVFLQRSKGDGNSIAWKTRSAPDSAFHEILPLDPNVFYNVVGHDGMTVYLQTNLQAPLSRLVALDLRDSHHTLHDIVPQSADKLQAVSLIGDRFYLGYLHDAHSVTRIYDLKGRAMGVVPVPGIGSGGTPGGRRTDRIAYSAFTSYTYPTTIFRYDTKTGTSTVYAQPKVAFDASPYVTELLFATSKDGAKVPVFLTHRKDMPYDGSTPVLQYGYGGFDIDETPSFRTTAALWLEMGGAYADVVLRGGGEYGEAWHDAGRLGEKQHVFDDFIAASQMMIDKKITSTPRLAINGGSNGGLLVGACETERPDLFGAAIPEVGVLDLLRYQRFTVGKAWIPEYGDATASADAFHWLYAYSPDANVKTGTHYPPTMVMTSDGDDRVFPAHSFKFAALLQNAQAGDAPILLRVESKAGHGGGRPTEKIIDDVADRYAFLVKNLNFTPASL